jgi:hypothetical protein
MHLPLVLADNGQKLSKQHNAKALDSSTQNSILSNLNAAGRHLGLECNWEPTSSGVWLLRAREAWGSKMVLDLEQKVQS